MKRLSDPLPHWLRHCLRLWVIVNSNNCQSIIVKGFRSTAVLLSLCKKVWFCENLTKCHLPLICFISLYRNASINQPPLISPPEMMDPQINAPINKHTSLEWVSRIQVRTAFKFKHCTSQLLFYCYWINRKCLEAVVCTTNYYIFQIGWRVRSPSNKRLS